MENLQCGSPVIAKIQSMMNVRSRYSDLQNYYIEQVSKNLVGQNRRKLTKVTGTQSNEMKQNEPKWSEVEQSGWDPVIQN